MKKLLIALLFIGSALHASIFSDAIDSFAQKDYDRAYTLFHRAINNQSSIQANYFLGLMHLRGLGTQQNLELAKRHLGVAATIGNVRARCLLAEVKLLEDDREGALQILNDASLQNIVECQQIKQNYNIK